MRHTQQRWIDREDEQASADRQTKSLAGLAVSLVLVVVGLGLIHILHANSAIEDCALSGRSNCGRNYSWPVTDQPPGPL